MERAELLLVPADYLAAPGLADDSRIHLIPLQLKLNLIPGFRLSEALKVS